MRLRVLTIVLAGVMLAGCSQEGIPLLGLDDEGKLVERFASDEQFSRELKKTATQVQSSAHLALRENASSLTLAEEHAPMLRTVAVGLGFNLSAGLGDLVTVGVSPRVRFIFSNSRNPIVP